MSGTLWATVPKRIAKFGLEVEGRFLGLRTLFCEAFELPRVLKNLPKLVASYDVEQLYIDHADTLSQEDYTQLSELSLIVTVEVTCTPAVTRGPNTRYMISVPVDPNKLGLFSPDLDSRDQIKMVSNYHVAALSCASISRSTPGDFSNDFEISEEGFL